ncbi:larval cuticle protein LCP-14 [Manduca sexta]|uniref:Larval cuticle protein LCP-14 n=2 Tax=Manduca sexta TaxID=7130 RepID=CU14_MANSE|nr:larval cuticle protein LCP-14 [Manduca sexta]P13229.1 RecName: Full=Larval cuticle protein LCP-14; Flags: Precursor [Manduca sexta]AAA29318.1 larval cuticle protein 14 [Manduca sexta]KAG6440626.1 hypothetical protein O3G_MSEX001397 [Manduca sexta]KAG6440627.1 hypothetical protein O3G_MSEX001397 [Manduca sexta]CAA31643.1 unnamed protein product [Manduca sexta]
MKSFIVALCVVGCVLANDPEAVVVRNDYVQNPEGSYNYAFESNNGISGQAEGKFKVFDKDSAAVVVAGSSQYKGSDGKVYSLTYVADENGYQPQADFLPTPPPTVAIPEYIARAVAYNLAHSAKV